MNKDTAKRLKMRGPAALLMAAWLLFAAVAGAPGCAPAVDLKKLEQQARREQRHQRLTPEMLRPHYMAPYSGPFPGGQDIPDRGFTMSVPEGGWYWNRGGLPVPDAAAVFVHGDTAPFDIVVAVAPDQPPVQWAADAAGETHAPGAAPVVTEYFKKWNKEFQPARSAEDTDTSPPQAMVRGYLTDPQGGGAAPLAHDTAVVYAYRQPDANTMLLIFTYSELFEDRLQIYIDDVVSHFKLK